MMPRYAISTSLLRISFANSSAYPCNTLSTPVCLAACACRHRELTAKLNPREAHVLLDDFEGGVSRMVAGLRAGWRHALVASVMMAEQQMGFTSRSC